MFLDIIYKKYTCIVYILIFVHVLQTLLFYDEKFEFYDLPHIP